MASVKTRAIASGVGSFIIFIIFIAMRLNVVLSLILAIICFGGLMLITSKWFYDYMKRKGEEEKQARDRAKEREKDIKKIEDEEEARERGRIKARTRPQTVTEGIEEGLTHFFGKKRR
jgi:predicted Holliday junction resolvase-like endonuclease